MIQPALNGVDLSAVPQNALNEYFGVWAIYNEHFDQIISRVQNINIAAHLDANATHQVLPKPKSRGELYAIETGGVAVVRMVGPMMKYSSSFSANVSTKLTRQALTHALSNPDVQAIVMFFDSPGGTVSGTADLANQIAEGKSKKPIYGFIEDLCASACYWCASQCTEVFANDPTALVGSIGTFAVIHDLSKMAEEKGIKVHVIRAGEFKGVATAGTEVTDEQIKEYQRNIQTLNKNFLEGVASGRRVTLTVVGETWADGRIHDAQTAVDMKMIDGIKTYGALIEDLASKNRNPKRMSDPQTPAATGPNLATLEQLEANCPGASSDFIIGQLKSKVTLEQGMKNWMTEQQKLLAAADADKAKAVEDAKAQTKTEIEEAAAEKDATAGIKPIGADMSAELEAEGGDVIAAFNNRVQTLMNNGMTDRAKAVRSVALKNQKLHQQYLLATNGKSRDRRLLQEKFENVES